MENDFYTILMFLVLWYVGMTYLYFALEAYVKTPYVPPPPPMTVKQPSPDKDETAGEIAKATVEGVATGLVYSAAFAVFIPVFIIASFFMPSPTRKTEPKP